MAEQTANNSVTNKMAGVFMLGFLFLMIALLLYIFRDELIYAWRIYRYYFYSISAYIPLIGPSSADLQPVLDFLKNTPSANIDIATAIRIDNEVNRSFGLIVGSLFITIGIRRMLALRGTAGRLNEEDEFQRMSKLFPALDAVKNNNPENMPLFYRHGKDNSKAASVTVFEFATMNPPIGLERSNERAIYLPDEKNWHVAFDKGIARKACEAQLGQPLGRVNDMSEAERNVYVHMRDLLHEHIGKKPSGKLINNLRNTHGFVRTFLMALFRECKRFGIYTVTEIMWLKEKDRVLYYALQSVNKDTPFMEAAGPYVHMELETMAGIRIMTPEVAEAVEALERYMEFDRETQNDKPTMVGAEGND